MLCKQLAAEWAPDGITVNVISPTFVRTPQGERFLHGSRIPPERPRAHPARPDWRNSDVVAAVAFLASPASYFVTGQTLYLDGGITATQ